MSAVPPGINLCEALQREDERLAVLDRYDMLDTPVEEAFDRITRLAQKLFQMPMATVSLIDGHRQWVKSQRGLVGIVEAPRGETVCNATIGQDCPLVIHDLRLDPRFAHLPSVMSEPGIRFYAGTALRAPDGHNIGTICTMDTKPREFSAEDADLLIDLAALAMDELELRLQATRDALTGALMRGAFKEQASRSVALALRYHEELSCIGLDLDHFKRINDTYGHAAGDRVLVSAARACAVVLRETDLVGRLGGEEFAILMPKTGVRGALEAAEKVRRAIANLRFDFGGKPVQLTASFGVAALDPATRDLDTLLAHADAALYQAKDTGRDRAAAWSAPVVEGPIQQRRRVLKGGQILFNDRASTIDCTVRSLSDEGAGLDVSSTVGIPNSFILSIRADAVERRARVIVQTERHMEVAFA